MDLEKQILEMIIERLDLVDIDVNGVDYDAPLFASFDDERIGLQLDSVDALELVVGINEKFGVKIGDEDMAIFRSISTIADFIREKTESLV
ncbi:acyl carrier protein [Paenibacillus albiflavus]|uniref:Acyl carrier protein n=1 Tax=Paenibacillus albiflavus TaxID=2545760 RepID=A0A4R4EGB3_9BACL|nr:phosphopantetheine-binding protein [Paenibacillus albiflavus]TCZ77175.1 acyl carrier protein [Paenibacillus albiflavus]